MDFDHLDGYDKKDKISKLIADNYSLDAIKEEVTKCELVCANCHHDRTFKRMVIQEATRPSVIYVRDIKHNKFCYDCDQQYPYWILHFDHKPEFEKICDINDMRYHASIEKIKQEIAKCDLICANCHRERTHTRKKENNEDRSLSI
jgi:hypothetical protein